MILGRVLGQVWATRRDPRLPQVKLLIVRPTGLYEPALAGPAFGPGHLVAIDHLDAGVGDQVVVCLGAPARAAAGGNDVPVDAAVMAVVDRADLDRDALVAPGAGPGIHRALTDAIQ
jgi:ethanolamine utilization protein EutN